LLCTVSDSMVLFAAFKKDKMNCGRE
jgi:hypothetical protein